METRYRIRQKVIDVTSRLHKTREPQKEEMEWKLFKLHCMLSCVHFEIIRLFRGRRIIFINIILFIIKLLQKANGSVQKFLEGFREQMVVSRLICRIKSDILIDYDYFNEVYTGFVERKRQSILKDIDRINNQFNENFRKRQEAGLPNEGLPAETRMKQAVLETCYAYLRDDDAYQQKAFRLFLKKKMEDTAENGVDCSRIEAYLGNKRKDSSYEEYKECISMPIMVHLPRLWVEFFRSGTKYTNMLPKEWPNVAYFSISTDVPDFIMEPPYVEEYSEQEFYARYAKEWETTHYNPNYDDECHEPADYVDYTDELADRHEKAYFEYLAAINQFRKIQRALKPDTEGN